MYVKRWFRRYRGEFRAIISIIVLLLLFNIYQLLRDNFNKSAEGSTLSISTQNEELISPTAKSVPTLVVPSNIHINIYINNTSPIYNNVYNSLLTQIPTIISSPSQGPTSIPNPTSTYMPTSTLTPTPTEIPLISDFIGKYFNNRNLAGTPALTRTDAQIDFQWGSGSPTEGINNDSFSVIWEGSINAQNGSYLINLNHDDGMRVYIDNMLVHDHWVNKSASEETISLNLIAGRHNLRIEYYEYLNGANAYFNIQKL